MKILTRGWASHRRAERGAGQSLVELALGLPLLLLLLLGTVDLGQMFFYEVQLRNAVREGAGYGAHFPTDTSGMTSRALAHGVPSGTTASASCSGGCSAANGVSSGPGVVTVSATYTFTPFTLSFFQTFGIGPVSLAADASMNVLQ